MKDLILILLIVFITGCSSNNSKNEKLYTTSVRDTLKKKFIDKENLQESQVSFNKDTIYIKISTFNKKSPIQEKPFFYEYLISLEDDFLKNYQNDSLLFQNKINNITNLSAYCNDSLYYLIYDNINSNSKRVIYTSSTSFKQSYLGSYIVSFDNCFLWGYGSSTSNKDWILYDITDGAFIMSGSNFIGYCHENGMIFFNHNNSILGYNVYNKKLFKVIDFEDYKEYFEKLDYYWNFQCYKRQLVIEYREKGNMKFFISDW